MSDLIITLRNVQYIEEPDGWHWIISDDETDTAFMKSYWGFRHQDDAVDDYMEKIRDRFIGGRYTE